MSSALRRVFTKFDWVVPITYRGRLGPAYGPRCFFLPNNSWDITKTTRYSQQHISTLTSDHSSEKNPQNHTPSESQASTLQPVKPLTAKGLLGIYSQLSKSRLTILIVLSCMSSTAVSPDPGTVPILLATALGTALCSASANTFNQIQEVPLDAQMTRTRNRPLARYAISPLHATGFGLVAGTAGTTLLWSAVNPTTALLGLSNIALYAGAYTYLKRRSISNTWVGAVVGGIPPLMGWTACHATDYLSSFSSHLSQSLGGLAGSIEPWSGFVAPGVLFMLLYSWQFPHFNSLSYIMRSSYARAGYQMLSVIDPKANSSVSLRHALLLLPICSIVTPLSGLTTWTFALTSLVPNLALAGYAWGAHQSAREQAARGLWWCSLWYLPVVLGLMMFHKKERNWMDFWGDKEKADSNTPQTAN